MKKNKSYTVFQGLWRKIKKNYYQLIRSKGATNTIARSFAIGMLIEFITLPTVGLAFFLLFPLIKLFRGVFSVALIGFIMGKIILPLFFVLNYSVGEFFIGKDVNTAVHHGIHQSFFMKYIGEKGLAYLLGSFMNGCVVALVCYFLVIYALNMYRKTKENRKHFRQQQRAGQLRVDDI